MRKRQRLLRKQKIVKWRIEEFVGLQIYTIILEIHYHIKPFEKIVSNHTVYIFF